MQGYEFGSHCGIGNATVEYMTVNPVVMSSSTTLGTNVAPGGLTHLSKDTAIVGHLVTIFMTSIDKMTDIC